MYDNNDNNGNFALKYHHPMEFNWDGIIVFTFSTSLRHKLFGNALYILFFCHKNIFIKDAALVLDDIYKINININFFFNYY